MTGDAAERDMRRVLNIFAQMHLEDAAIKFVVQRDDRIRTLTQHQYNEFVNDAVDIAERHRQPRPVADDAANVGRDLRRRQTRRKGKYQRHMRGQRVGEWIVETAKILDRRIDWKWRKPDDRAAR